MKRSAVYSLVQFRTLNTENMFFNFKKLTKFAFHIYIYIYIYILYIFIYIYIYICINKINIKTTINVNIKRKDSLDNPNNPNKMFHEIVFGEKQNYK